MAYFVRSNKTRKIYEEAFGEIPKKHHIHHKIPVHVGGDDSPENLIALNVEDHAKAHLELFEKYNNLADYRAFLLLSGRFEEVQQLISRAGGKIGGKRVKELGKGIFNLSEEEIKRNASMGGKAGSKRCKELGVSAFYDPILKKEISSKGGKASGSFRNSELQRQRGMKGGKKNAGSIWLNDGEREYKFKGSEEELEIYLKDNPNVERSKLKKLVFLNDGKTEIRLHLSRKDFEKYLQENPHLKIGKMMIVGKDYFITNGLENLRLKNTENISEEEFISRYDGFKFGVTKGISKRCRH